MKIVLTGTMCGPKGNGYRGTVLELPDEEAKQLIRDRSARPYDHAKDSRAPHGLVKAER